MSSLIHYTLFSQCPKNLSIHTVAAFLLHLHLVMVSVQTVAGIRPPLFVPCNSCCPSIFNSDQGVINIRESHWLIHSISYYLRCLLSTEETIIVSDAYLFHPIPFYGGSEDDQQICTQAEQIPFALISVQQFLASKQGILQKSVFASKPRTFDSLRLETQAPFIQHDGRLNFLFTPISSDQMISLVKKVEEEMRFLRADNKFFWQPHIIFLWPEIQYTLRSPHDSFGKEDTIPGQKLLDLWFKNYKPNVPLDSAIFFCFMVQKGNSTRSQKNLYMNVWEGYTLKGNFILKRVTDNQLHYLNMNGNSVMKRFEGDEKCTFQLRDERVSAMEKINGYIFKERHRRRGDFRRMPLIASISVQEVKLWIKITQRKLCHVMYLYLRNRQNGLR